MRRTIATTRPGISRVEVGVLLVIGLLLVGGLVIGIGNWRESEARVQCQFNLSKIGESIFRYSEARKHLPASCIEKQYATWAVQIAPFLPEPADKSLASWDLATRYYDQPEAVRIEQVQYYYCPARRRPPQLSVSGDVPSNDPEGKEYPGALGDYACCSGNGSEKAPWDTPAANGAIIIGKVLKKDGQRIERWTGRTLLDQDKSLVRGLSYTIVIGEKHVPLEHWGQRTEGDGSLYNGDYFGSFARVGGPGFGLAQSPADPYHRNFGSYHAGICYFLFADNSVQAFNNSMNESVLGKLTNRFPE
jgi:hypothetical protein